MSVRRNPEVDTGGALGDDAAAHALERVDAVYRSDSRVILATLIRLLGDFDLAEEGLHDAFTAAMDKWPREGVPSNPRSWLISTGRFRAIDRLRRRARFDDSASTVAEELYADAVPEPDWDPDDVIRRMRRNITDQAVLAKWAKAVDPPEVIRWRMGASDNWLGREPPE